MRPVLFEVPALGVRRSIGVTVAGEDRCKSAVTKRGWVHVLCADGEESGAVAKIVAVPGEIVIVRAGNPDTAEHVPIPCAYDVRLHPLPCAPPDRVSD